MASASLVSVMGCVMLAVTTLVLVVPSPTQDPRAKSGNERASLQTLDAPDAPEWCVDFFGPMYGEIVAFRDHLEHLFPPSEISDMPLNKSQFRKLYRKFMASMMKQAPVMPGVMNVMEEVLKSSGYDNLDEGRASVMAALADRAHHDVHALMS